MLLNFYHRPGGREGDYLELHPIDILGKPADKTYADALNHLISEKLIIGINAGGRPGFSLNPAKMEEILKELQWYRNPLILFLVPTLIALAGIFLAVLKFFLEK
jgi:hypothetical protein